MKGSFMSSGEVNDPFMTCGRPSGDRVPAKSCPTGWPV